MNRRLWWFLLVSISLVLLFADSGHSARLHRESWYQNKYCTGDQEVVLPDKTRVDCVTTHYAIEFGFADQWLSDIGQALHYSRSTKKHPGIFMVVETDKDLEYVQKARWLTECLDIVICTNRDVNCVFNED